MRIIDEQGAAVAFLSRRSLVVAALLLVYAFVLVRNAWLCDDAYITYRTVQNFANGYGLTWNTAERVQAYTHPLWMLLHAASYAFTREVYYTSLAISLIGSLGAVSLGVVRLSVSTASAAVGFSVLLFSKAFVDFSTSGLENPLTHLVLVVFLLLYFGRRSRDEERLAWLAFAAALGVMNRMDTLLLFLPPLIDCLWRARSLRAFLLLGLGFVPFMAWELFSLVYYGFLVPNTAYAKLSTGVAASELAVQGLAYLLDSLTRDYITAPAILGAFVAVVATRRRELLPVAMSVLLYLLYAIKIGGDFMSGRLLTAPLFCAVALIWRLEFTRWALWLAQGAIVVGGLLSPSPPALSGSDYGAAQRAARASSGEDVLFRESRGITDERAFYYPGTGLLKAFEAMKEGAPWPGHEWADVGRERRVLGPAIAVESAVGLIGFFAGPQLHIVDPAGLADPLLARLPTARGWRIGHFFRVIPNGYLESLASGRNQICDERLAAYYDKLLLVTRGELFDRERLVEIWKLNTGQYEDLIERALYRELPLEHNQKGLAEYSVEELEALLQAGPRDAYAQYKLGIAAAIRGDLHRAIAHWEAAAREHPHDRCVRGDLEVARQMVTQSP